MSMRIYLQPTEHRKYRFGTAIGHSEACSLLLKEEPYYITSRVCYLPMETYVSNVNSSRTGAGRTWLLSDYSLNTQQRMLNNNYPLRYHSFFKQDFIKLHRRSI